MRIFQGSSFHRTLGNQGIVTLETRKKDVSVQKMRWFGCRLISQRQQRLKKNEFFCGCTQMCRFLRIWVQKMRSLNSGSFAHFFYTCKKFKNIILRNFKFIIWMIVLSSQRCLTPAMTKNLWPHEINPCTHMSWLHPNPQPFFDLNAFNRPAIVKKTKCASFKDPPFTER